MSAGFDVECARCKEQLDAPGALLFSTPRQRKRCVPTTAKRHLCGECYRDVIGFIRRGRSGESSPNAEEEGT